MEWKIDLIRETMDFIKFKLSNNVPDIAIIVKKLMYDQICLKNQNYQCSQMKLVKTKRVEILWTRTSDAQKLQRMN
jgi:hypothetical protein